MRWCFAALACLLAASAAGAPPSEPASNTDLLRRAEAAFDRGASLYAQDPEGARIAFVESAAAYGTLAYDRQVRNARLLANLGNASLMAGDTGRAVLAWRRAERLDPADPAVRAGLSLARARVGVQVDVSERRLAGPFANWRSVLPPQAIILVGAAAWVLGWLALAVDRTLPAARRTRSAGAAAVILGAACIGIVTADQALRQRSPEAVVITDSAVGRNGPGGALYEASFDKPLAPGVEVRMLEERGEWARVRLGDGRETWLPASSLERV